MRYLRPYIHDIRSVDRIQIFRITFPPPGNAFVQCRAGNILNALHKFNQAVFITSFYWRKANPAITHHSGCHAMPTAWCQLFVPAYLAIVVGMDIHETWRQKLTTSIDLPGCFADALGQICEFDNFAIFNADRSVECRFASTIDDIGVRDCEVEHRSLLNRFDCLRLQEK